MLLMRIWEFADKKSTNYQGRLYGKRVKGKIEREMETDERGRNYIVLQPVVNPIKQIYIKIQTNK